MQHSATRMSRPPQDNGPSFARWLLEDLSPKYEQLPTGATSSPQDDLCERIAARVVRDIRKDEALKILFSSKVTARFGADRVLEVVRETLQNQTEVFNGSYTLEFKAMAEELEVTRRAAWQLRERVAMLIEQLQLERSQSSQATVSQEEVVRRLTEEAANERALRRRAEANLAFVVQQSTQPSATAVALERSSTTTRKERRVSEKDLEATVETLTSSCRELESRLRRLTSSRRNESATSLSSLHEAEIRQLAAEEAAHRYAIMAEAGVPVRLRSTTQKLDLKVQHSSRGGAIHRGLSDLLAAWQLEAGNRGATAHPSTPVRPVGLPVDAMSGGVEMTRRWMRGYH